MKIEISDSTARELAKVLRAILGDPTPLIRSTAGHVIALDPQCVRGIKGYLSDGQPCGTTALRENARDFLPADDKAAYKALTQLRSDPAFAGWWKRSDKKNSFGHAFIVWQAPESFMRSLESPECEHSYVEDACELCGAPVPD